MDENRGKNLGTASMVCGILSLVLMFFGYGALIGVVLAIVAIVLSVNAKKAGFEGGTQKAGLVLGIIGAVLCGISFLACTICVGGLAALGASMS